MKNYYSWERISPTMTRIHTDNECCYLVEGTDRAALLDSGIGIGDISQVVRQLTQLPVILLLTHGHVDHLGGAMGFPVRYLSPLDWELAKTHGSYAVRKSHLLSQGLPEAQLCDIQTAQVEGFLPLHGGDVFDLGGVHLRALPLPGHTPGSMAIVHEEERTVLLGDACNTLTFLFLPGSLTVEEYRDNLIAFRDAYMELFDTALFSHFETAGVQVISENIAVCQDILDGKHDGPAFRAGHFAAARGAWIAKAIVGHPKARTRADGRQGNIVFSADKIRREQP